MKGCPFCGGVGMLDYSGGSEVVDKSWQCKCGDCGAKTRRFFGSNTWQPETQATRAADADARKNALYAWERRSKS